MALINAFSAPGLFFKGNIHTHSTRSDGVRSPEEVCRIYRDGGYDFLCLTDHFIAQFDFTSQQICESPAKSGVLS